jgi:hypothetical protein
MFAMTPLDVIDMRLQIRPLHPARNPAKNDPFFENTARQRSERAGCPPVSVPFFALYLKKWREWRALPAENIANKAGILIIEIGNVEACSRCKAWGRVGGCADESATLRCARASSKFTFIIEFCLAETGIRRRARRQCSGAGSFA